MDREKQEREKSKARKSFGVVFSFFYFVLIYAPQSPHDVDVVITIILVCHFPWYLESKSLQSHPNTQYTHAAEKYTRTNQDIESLTISTVNIQYTSTCFKRETI